MHCNEHQARVLQQIVTAPPHRFLTVHFLTDYHGYCHDNASMNFALLQMEYLLAGAQAPAFFVMLR